jgi:hypothetical protein
MMRLRVICGVALSISCAINWWLINWARKALGDAPQGTLPLPAFTQAVFHWQLALLAPLVIFALCAMMVVNSPERERWPGLALAGGTFATILAMGAAVSVACLLPWLPRVP